ncbi:pentapeptide repeat protein [Halothece sp. PCC 7418]|uniref:pentapeptide repeat-containing protein n=1 Tax=Halothece sp. (strain PCC 7418) TaxID=65093 RepID=UPI0002A06DBA|nr:pentapeptide repeat-containing protein [Halothece sp. PCC 7418]AFZ44443.1 pentapeptide repeat protein [Halothece sp. PCC 7418]
MSLRTATTATFLTVLLSPSVALAENLTDLNQLLSTQTCQHCNLVNAGLVRAELAGAQLQGANLTNANLSRANLTGADLRGANLTGASLHGANLTGANLTGAILNQTDLRKAYLNNAQLENTTLETAYIRGAIGVPTSASSAKQFYKLAAAEAEAGNYEAALEYCNLAIRLDPEYAAAYLGRGVARYRLGDQVGATQDAEIALELFTQQENEIGVQASQQFMKAVEIASQPRDSNGGGGGLNRLFTTVGSLLMRFFF